MEFRGQPEKMLASKRLGRNNGVGAQGEAVECRNTEVKRGCEYLRTMGFLGVYKRQAEKWSLDFTTGRSLVTWRTKFQ